MKTFKDVLANYPQAYQNAFGNYEPKMWRADEETHALTIVLEDCNPIRFTPTSGRHYGDTIKVPTNCGTTLELNLKAIHLEASAIHDDLDAKSM